MNDSLLSLFLAAVLVWQTAASSAAEGATDEASDEAIARAVQEMGDARFSVRKAASRFLWRQGLRAEAALQQASQSSDFEVRQRARGILRDFEYGLLPDIPREVAELIARFRSGNSDAKQRVVLAMLERERFDNALRLIRLDEEPESRHRLLVLLFQNPAAMDRYATAEKIEALVELVASDQDEAWRRRAVGQLLFSPAMIERLTENGQLETLTKFLEDEKDTVVRSQVLNSVFGNRSILATILKHGDLPLLLALLEAAPDESQRAQLLTRLLANQEAIRQILDEEKLDDVLSLLEKSLDGPARRDALMRLFQSPAMSLLLEQRDVDQLVQWLRQEKNAELRGQLLAALMSSPLLQQKLVGDGRLRIVVDVAADDPQPAARRAYLEALLQNPRGAILNDQATKLGLWQLVKSDEDASWRVRPLVTLVRSGVMADIFADKEESEWLLETIRTADDAGTRLFESLLDHHQALAGLLQHGHFDALYELAQDGEDHQRGSWLARLVRHPATAEYLKSTNQMPRLLAIARDETSPTARLTYLQGLVVSQASVTALVGDGHYDAISELVLAIDDAVQRATLFGRLTLNSAVPQHLLKQNQLSTLLEFAEAQETAEVRAAFLQSLFNSNALTLLLERGEYDQLQAYVDEQPAAGNTLAASFYTNAMVLERLVEEKQIDELLSRAEAMDQAARSNFLQRLVYSRGGRNPLVAAGHLDSLVSLLRSEPNAARRGSYLGTLLGSPDVAEALAAEKKLSTVSEIIRAEEDAMARRPILQQMLGNSSTLTVWVRAEMLDSLIELIHEEDDLRLKGDLLRSLATSPVVIELWKKEQRLSSLLTLADSFGRGDAAYEARRNYLARLLGNSALVTDMIGSELFPEMLKIATREPEPSARSSMLQSLVRNGATVDYLKSKNQLSQLLSVAWDEPAEQVRQGYLQGLVGNSAAITSLVEAGLYAQVAELLSGMDDAVQRATLFGRLTQNAAVMKHLVEQNQIDTLLEFAEEQETAEARAAYLQSLFNSNALARLLERGHYDQLLAYVDAQPAGALAASFFTNAAVIKRLMEEKQIAQLIARSESMDQESRSSFLQRLVHDRAALNSLIEARQLDALMTLLRAEPSAGRRGSYLGILLGSTEVVESLAAQEKLDTIIEIIQAEEDVVARRPLLEQVIRSSEALHIWARSEMLDPLIDLIREEDDPRLKADLLARLLTSDLVVDQWAKEQRLVLVLSVADSFGGDVAADTARRDYLARVFTNGQLVQKLVGSGLYDAMLRVATQEPEANARSRMLQSLMQHQAVANYLKSKKELPKLLSYPSGERSEEVRQAYLGGLVSNSTAVTFLVEAGLYSQTAEIVLATEDVLQRANLFGRLTQHASVTQHLGQKHEIDGLLEFAEAQETAQARAAFLQWLFNSSALTLLLERGHYDQLLGYVDEQPATRNTLAASFYTNAVVLDRLVEEKQIDELMSRAEAMDPAARSGFLQRLVYSRGALKALVAAGHLDPLLSLLRSEPNAPQRASYLAALLGSSEVAEALVAEKKLNMVVEIMRAEEDANARTRILQQVLSNSSTLSIWVRSEMLDSLIELIHEEDDLRLKGDLLARLATSDVIWRQWAKEQRLSSVLSIADSFGSGSAANESRRNYLLRVLSNPNLTQTLIKSGLYEDLLELIAQDSEPNSRSRLLQSLVQNPATADYLKSKNQLPQLLSFARKETSEQVRHAYLQALVGSHTAIASLVKGGLYKETVDAVLATDDAVQRAGLFGRLAQHRSVGEHLAEHDEIDLLLDFADEQAGLEARHAFLQPVFSSQTLTLLVQRGHYDRLRGYLDDEAPSRDALKASFFANIAVTERLMQEKQADQLLARADALGPEARHRFLQQLLHQHDTLGELARAGHFDALVSLIRSESNASRRAALLGSLLASPKVVGHLAAEEELGRVLEVVRTEKDADARQSVVSRLLGDSRAIQLWVSSDMLDQVIEVVRSESGQAQQASQLGRLVVTPSVLERWANRQQLASVFTLAESLGDEHGPSSQREYLRHVFGNTSAVRVLVEGGLLEHLLEAIDNDPDSSSQANMLQLLMQNSATATQLAKQGQLERLVEIVRNTEHTFVRQAGVAGIAGNQAAVSGLINAGLFEPLVELCRQESDEAARRRLKALLLQSPRAVMYLAERDQLVDHLHAAMGESDTNTRRAFFRRLVTQAGVPTAIDNAGSFGEVLNSLEAELEAPDARLGFGPVTYSKEFLELLVDHGRTPLIVSLLTVDPDQGAIRRYLSTLLGNPKVLRAVLEQEPIDRLLQHGDTRESPYQPSIWSDAIQSPEAIAILADYQQLDRLFADVAEDPQSHLKHQLSTTLLRPESRKLLNESDVPMRLLSLVRNSGTSQNRWMDVQRLLSHSGLRQALIARGEVDSLLDLLPLTRAADRDRLRREILFSPSGLLPHHLSRGELDVAEQIIEEEAAEGDERRLLLASLLLASGKLHERISELQQRTADAAEASIDDLRTLVYLHRADGDLEAAGAAAEQTGDAGLIHAITLERRQWHAAAQQLAAEDIPLPIPLPRSPPSEKHARVERLGRLAAYWRLAGETERADEVLDQIEQLADGSGKPIRWDYAEALLLNDRVQPGLALLETTHPQRAFELLCFRQEYAAALKLLDCDADASFDSDWYAALPMESRSDNELYQRRQRLEFAMRIARILQRLGRTEEMDKLVEFLASHARQQPETEDNQEWRRLHWKWLAGELYRTELYPRAWQAAEQAIKPGYESPVLSSLFASRGGEAVTWWIYFRRAHGDEPVQETMQRIHHVLHPGPSDAAENFERMLEEASDVEAMEPHQVSPTLTSLADTCIERERWELAQRLLKQVPDLQPFTWPKQAKLLGQLGRHREAGEAWMNIWKSDPNRLEALYLAGDALVHSGDVEEGTQRKEQASQLAFESLVRHRMALALHRGGLTDAAAEQWELVVKTAPMDHWEWHDAVRLLGDQAHQRQDPQAADDWEQYMLMNLRTTSSFNEIEYCLRLPYMIRTHRATAAAAEGDCDAAVEQAELALAAMPGQTSVVEDLVPQLQQLECHDAADALYDRVREHYHAALADFPESADLQNNLAWLSARCHRDLDEALVLSRRAVELRPTHAGYIDTLAEVHFHRGDRDEAVRLSERSVSLAPANATFQKQLQRFRNESLPE